MAKLHRRFRPRQRDGTKIRPSEAVVILLILAGSVYAGRYYFLVYRRSPQFVVESYLGAVKSGRVERQYQLIDDTDRQSLFPTQADYEKKAPQAHGYTERVTNVSVVDAKVNPKQPDWAVVDTAVSLRGSAAGKALYQEGGTTEYKDRYVLHKDGKGDWKILLSQSTQNMLAAKPNAPADPM
jgi:hypothetical protein